MQQVLNSQERNQAFLKFLLFFVITVALIIGAVFFNYKLPLRENRMLQSEVEVQRVQDANQQKFVTRMEEAIVLLDSMEKKGANFQQIDLQLGSKMGELATLQQKDITAYGKMNKVIVDRLQQLKDNKKSMLEANINTGKLANLQSELDKCKDESIILHGQLDALRKSSGF